MLFQAYVLAKITNCTYAPLLKHLSGSFLNTLCSFRLHSYGLFLWWVGSYLQRHDPVTVALFRVPPFHACGHEGAAVPPCRCRERARLTLAQQGDELGKGNGQGLFVRTGGTEVAGKSLFRRTSTVEGHVGMLISASSPAVNQ